MNTHGRVARLVGHLDPDAAEEKARSQTIVNAAPVAGMGGMQGMMTSLLPMLAIGGYMFFQNRGKNKEEKREFTELERVSEELGFDVERMDALGEWADKLIKKKQLPGVVIAVARKGRLVFHEAFGDRTYQRDSILAIEGMVTPVSLKQQLSCAGSVRLGEWIAVGHTCSAAVAVFVNCDACADHYRGTTDACG